MEVRFKLEEDLKPFWDSLKKAGRDRILSSLLREMSKATGDELRIAIIQQNVDITPKRR
jgi:hypothetical protein